MKRNVVVIHPGALGDVLLAVPAIREFAARFPRRQLLLFARASIGRLLAECRVIDGWISTESQVCSGLFARRGSQSDELRSVFERCDAAVAWTEDVDGALGKVLRQYGVPKLWIQSPFSPSLQREHQRERFLETIDGNSAKGIGEYVLRLPDHLREEGRIYLENKGILEPRSLVLAHPGSGSIHKCLRPEKFAHIIRQLQHQEMAPVLLEGPADHKTVDGVLRELSKKPPVLRGFDLSLVAGVLTHAELYLGHDSGVTHLAALLGVRTVAMFGPTDSDRWAPHGHHVTILRGPSCVCPTWQAVKNCHEKSCLDLRIEELAAAIAFEVGA
jgi:ADP-heptose:LPS heptosyltransferase